MDKEIITFAHRLADTAGEILRRSFGKPFATQQKADASPVTDIDREVETALRALIEKHYPEHGIVGEEFGNARAGAPLQWVLDPIDGTHAFIAEVATFTTLIALAKDGVPFLGVIDQPITKERWVGMAGVATTLNGQPVRPRDCGTLAQATLTTTGMKYFKPEQAKIFERLKDKCSKVAFGGDAYLYGGLVCGKLDLVVEANLKPYDFCAPIPVVEGTGAVITDWDGKPLTIASDGRVVAAANKELHRQALSVLQSAT